MRGLWKRYVAFWTEREAPESLVELRGVEEPGERFSWSRLLVAADPFPAPAADDGGREDGDRHENAPTHVKHSRQSRLDPQRGLRRLAAAKERRQASNLLQRERLTSLAVS